MPQKKVLEAKKGYGSVNEASWGRRRRMENYSKLIMTKTEY